MMPLRRVLLTLALIAPLCACSLLPKGEADNLYRLKAQAPAPAASTLPMTLKISRPQSAPGLDSNRIAVLQSENSLNHYTGSAWSGPLPDITQNFLADAFEQSHAFRVVGTDAQPLKSDVTLLTDIRECHVDITGGGAAVKLRVTFTLVGSLGREPLAFLPVEKSVAVEGGGIDATIAAFNTAFNQAAADAIPLAENAAKGYYPLK